MARTPITTGHSPTPGRTQLSKLTPDERKILQSSGLFDERPDALCQDCGGYHLRTCPRVKRIVQLGNGNRTETEYFEKWDESSVIFIDDVYDTEDDCE
jgi:hypothetical protein